MQRIGISGEEEPVRLTHPLRDSQPEGEREREIISYHIMMFGDHCVKRILAADVHGRRRRRRQRKRWINTISQDLIILNLIPVDA